ncbi:Anaerobic ribonucleoside-triphosphate reductase [compost metagenome]
MHPTLEQIRKRDGRIVPYDPQRIAQAIAKATGAVHGIDPALSESLSQSVAEMVERQSDSGLATVEQIQDAIEAVLIEAGLPRAAKAFILYRARRSRIREGKSELMLAVNDVLSADDPVLSPASPASKLWAVGSAASQEYYLKRMLPEEDAVAHMRGELHVEGLDSYAKAPTGLVVPVSRLLSQGLSTPWTRLEPSRDPQEGMRRLALALQALSSEVSGTLSLDPFDTQVGDWFADASDAELSRAIAAFLETLAMPTGRSDAPLPVAIAFGADPAPAARRVAAALLEAIQDGAPRLAPTLVMRLRPGTNLNAGDPGYDLFQAAVKTASRRLAPLFVFGDEPILGSGMRLAPDRFGAPAEGRSVVASVAINLPRLAFLARRDHQAFDSQLLQVLDQAGRHLAYRMHVLGQLKARELPLLVQQGLHAGAERLASNDTAAFALRHGQLNVSFVGLAEALTLLQEAHHGEAAPSQERGLAMVRLMSETVAAMAERHDLNMVLSGHASEEAAVRFVGLDRRDFGGVPGVTDRPAYTPSALLPTDFAAVFDRRLAREAAYHRFCAGGNGVFRVVSGEPDANEVALRRMQAEGIGLAALGWALDVCGDCGREAGCGCASRDGRRICRPAVELALWEGLAPERQAELQARSGAARP